MGNKGMEWPGLNAALAGFLPLRPDMRHLVPGAEGLIYTPSAKYNKYQYINQKSFALAIVFAISVSLTALVWLTSAYDNAILKLVSIRDDIDTVFENWRSPPTRPRLLVHIFNYTNAKGIVKGEVPHVQEVGPFVFSEKMERTNVEFNPNGTVSFQEIRRIEHLPQLSNGSLNDTIWVPNIAFLTILDKTSKVDFAIQTIFSGVLHNLKPQLIINVTVNNFTWGIQDQFFTFLQSFKSLVGDDIRPFGFLAKRRGVHHDIVTMNTGNPDLNTVGIITRWNGASRIGKWGETECDQLASSDGSLFPARFVNEKKPLFVNAQSMCRRLPLYFNKSTSSKDGFPVHQYNVDREMFNYQTNDKNKCFSIDGQYPRNGVFYTGLCQNGAPIFASFPHFLNGDPTLREDVHGLTPDEDKHQSYFHIHERLGVSLLVKTRFQLNIMLRKPNFVSQTENVTKDKLILPVGWLEYDSGILEEDFIDAIYHLTYTVRIVEEVLKYSLLFLCLGSFAMFVLEIKKCVKK